MFALSLLVLRFFRTSGDFRIFLEASEFYRDGKVMYNQWLPAGDGGACLHFYSPLFSLILLPFTYVPSFIPNFLWLTLSVLFLLRIWKLLTRLVAFGKLSDGKKALLLFLTTLMTYRFIEYNFGMIQMTIFILWSMLESDYLFEKNKNIQGGILLALAINIKILPIVILPYLIYRSRWQAFTWTILFSILCLFIPAFYSGWDWNLMIHKEWWSAINPLNADHTLETEIGMHGFTALVPAYYSGDANHVLMIVNILRLIFIGLTLYILRWPPFKPANNNSSRLRELSYIILITPLIFPHQGKYAFLLMLPAMFYVLFFLISSTTRSRMWMFILISVILVFALTTLTTDGLIGRSLNQLTQQYKLITFGAMWLAVALNIEY